MKNTYGLTLMLKQNISLENCGTRCSSTGVGFCFILQCSDICSAFLLFSLLFSPIPFSVLRHYHKIHRLLSPSVPTQAGIHTYCTYLLSMCWCGWKRISQARQLGQHNIAQSFIFSRLLLWNCECCGVLQTQPSDNRGPYSDWENRPVWVDTCKEAAFTPSKNKGAKKS